VTEFPTDFLWGSATAAHQVEGGNTNSDWWTWEHTPGSAAVEPSGDAIDHYHRYDEDFALLASLGQNAHRFSVEWSRIEPAEGEFSQAALDHYKRVLESLAAHGLTALTTLYHFTLPRWFAERGGWLADDALDLFGRYVERVAGALGDLTPYFCTINEPQIQALMAHGRGTFPPGHQDMAEAAAVNARLAAAHRTATAAVRSGKGNPLVGTCLQLPAVEPFDPSNEDDVQRAAQMQHFLVDSHLSDLRAGGDVGDFVGLQYYTRIRVDADRVPAIAPPEEGLETTQVDWEVYPQGFRSVLRRLGEVGLPIIVSENGIATADDAQRIRFLALHLEELRAAMGERIDVRGYMYWSSFDNFEWFHGYGPTFGLIGIERDNGFRRVVRRSAELYGEVARTGSLEPLRQG
jgi:beta-glucosidase